MESLKFKERCPIHPNEKIEFMRINYSDNSKGQQPFFCCSFCINQNDSIKLDDYQSIKYLMKSNPNEVVRKWPPIQNQQIIDNLIEKTKGKSSTNDIVEQVIQFFSEFKKQIIELIDKQQKKMIQLAETIPESISQAQIVKQYQEISKIEELKKELLNTNSSLDKKENICKELIQQSKSSQNTELLQNLLNNLSQNIIFDNKSALIEQQQILNTIQNINLFKNITQQQQLINPQTFDVKLIKTNFRDSHSCLEINQNSNNQSEVLNIKYNDYYHSAVSNIVLDQNLKYKFRFQINHLENGNSMFIGLISDDNKDSNNGWMQKICCQLQNQDNLITKKGNDMIQKYLQGYQFVLSAEKQVEMRVHIKENILELLDYPNYQCKIGLDDQFIPHLIKAKDLRVLLGLAYNNNKVTLTDAQIVNNFD